MGGAPEEHRFRTHRSLSLSKRLSTGQSVIDTALGTWYVQEADREGTRTEDNRPQSRRRGSGEWAKGGRVNEQNRYIYAITEMVFVLCYPSLL